MMSTISVTVNQSNHAAMLAEWLRNIRFVEEVEIQPVKSLKGGNAGKIQKIIDSMKTKPFTSIEDPITYQRQLRDEWVH